MARGKEREDPRYSWAFQPSVRNRRRRRAALSQDWGRWAALDPHVLPRAFSQEISSYKKKGGSCNTELPISQKNLLVHTAITQVQKFGGWNPEFTYKPSHLNVSTPFLSLSQKPYNNLTSRLKGMSKKMESKSSRWLGGFVPNSSSFHLLKLFTRELQRKLS